MKKILKKYIEEQIDKIETYDDNIIHDFAFNTQDKKVVVNITTPQFKEEKIDLIKINSKVSIKVLGVETSKTFIERILKNLPAFERKEKLIVELANVISEEMTKLELKKQEYINNLSINTSNSEGLFRLEKIYGITYNYELGVLIRQNILISREISRYSVFNYEYIYKICQLFNLGEVIDIKNDKINHIINITLKENINNITTLKEFYIFAEEIFPAFYKTIVKN